MVEMNECNGVLLSPLMSALSNTNIVNNEADNVNINYQSDPYYTTTTACLFFITLTFIVSTLTKNYSQVDKLWSITPVLYSLLCITDTRTLIMATLTSIWGIRLTYNFYRRGGYKWPPWDGEEDYRWKFVQEGEFMTILTNPVVWFVFNFVFISLYQTILLWLIVTPSLVAYTMAHNDHNDTESSLSSCGAVYTPYNVYGLDGIATIFFLFFVALETVADKQQYNFQTEKYRRINAGEELTGEYADGFNQSGLFALLRKPNYAAEQAIWITYYFFGVASMNGANDGKILLWWNWTALGWILLVALFYSSGNLTENITLKKYPLYRKYQRKVGCYVPFVMPFLSRVIGDKDDSDDDVKSEEKKKK